MKKWDLTKKPEDDLCPKQYCFCWVPPGGSADISGQSYDTFEEAVEAGRNGVVLPNGGCGAPFGPCVRETKNEEDSDLYEPCNRTLKKHDLPELFFCRPEQLDSDDKKEYERTVRNLWSSV